MKVDNRKKQMMLFSALAVLLALGAGLASAQNAKDDSSWDASSEVRERAEMPTSKNLPNELTPPGVPVGQMEPTATLTPMGSVTPDSE